ncbi:MAG: cytidine deaminase [Planctomycetes bacterium]|nr:cytidine deaminase [Planctomycetota bacterium]
MTTDSELAHFAQEARGRAWAPYSNFRVGAAVLTQDGRVFTGCNVENASYGLTVCAERNAVAAAVVAGARRFSVLAVSSENGVAPCGACRQVLFEFGGELRVLLCADDGALRETSLAALLPQPFGPSSLPSGQH